MVAEVLVSNGIQGEWTDRIRNPSLRFLQRFDVVYGIYLQTCSRYIVAAKCLGKKTLIHFVGSDAYWVAREKAYWRRAYWKFVLGLTDELLFVSSHLAEVVGREGTVLPFPIATEQFRQIHDVAITPERDILYYCPSGPANELIYRLDWIVEYARAHPDETITIVGNSSHPANYDLALPNVLVVPYVEHSEMPQFYRKHKKLVRMTTEDGLPRMVHEAILCGLQVIFNGREIRDVPVEREPSEFAIAFRKVLSRLSADWDLS